jgi:hypothetical protein
MGMEKDHEGELISLMKERKSNVLVLEDQLVLDNEFFRHDERLDNRTNKDKFYKHAEYKIKLEK